MEQKEIDQLTMAERVAAKTPKFFKTIKIIGLTLLAASGAVLVAPVALPAIITTVAGYVALAGTVATAVSQVTVEGH